MFLLINKLKETNKPLSPFKKIEQQNSGVGQGTEK